LRRKRRELKVIQNSSKGKGMKPQQNSPSQYPHQQELEKMMKHHEKVVRFKYLLLCVSATFNLFCVSFLFFTNKFNIPNITKQFY